MQCSICLFRSCLCYLHNFSCTALCCGQNRYTFSFFLLNAIFCPSLISFTPPRPSHYMFLFILLDIFSSSSTSSASSSSFFFNIFLYHQARSQRGACSAVHPLGICKISRNNKLISPLKKRATPYRIHMSPLLSRRGWKQFIFKNFCTSRCFMQCYTAHYRNKIKVLIWGPDKNAFTLMHT